MAEPQTVELVDFESVSTFIRSIIHYRVNNALNNFSSEHGRTSFTSDLVQDALTALSSSVEGWAGLAPSEQRRYLARAAHNAANYYLRKSAKQTSTYTNMSDAFFVDQIVDKDASTTTFLIEIYDSLRRHLDDDELDVLTLIIAGSSYIEVSNIVGRPVSMVRRTINKARSKLEQEQISII